MYRPRRARESPLFRLVEQHLEQFLRVYEERFAKMQGLLRPVVGRVPPCPASTDSGYLPDSTQPPRGSDAPFPAPIAIVFVASVALASRARATPRPWVEVRTPHFTVASDAGESTMKIPIGTRERGVGMARR